MPVKLTAGQSTKITSDCVRQVSGSTRPFNPAETLQMFGINFTQQITAVRTNIVSSGSIGVPAFNFSLNPGFLATLNNQWLMGQLSDVIRNNSVPTQPRLAIAAGGVGGVPLAGAGRGGAAKKAGAKKAGAKKAGAKKAGAKKSAKKSSGAKKTSKKGASAGSGAKRSTVKSTKKTSAKKSSKKGKGK